MSIMVQGYYSNRRARFCCLHHQALDGSTVHYSRMLHKIYVSQFGVIYSTANAYFLSESDNDREQVAYQTSSRLQMQYYQYHVYVYHM